MQEDRKETTLQDLTFRCETCGNTEPLKDDAIGAFCPGCGKQKKIFLKGEHMQQLVLVRGLPGSGKTTLAKGMVGFKHFEADQYFTSDEGEFLFDPKEIRNAHQWCQESTVEALVQGFDVVVSNTFTQLWEMEFYKEYAKEYGIHLAVITAKGEFPNTHGVPTEKIQQMQDRWED
jgi:hypothetical protein